ncbi:MAG TPA: DUF2203 domain-containing protein [Candidatus Acidoferrales bacterium]|nr:DUF2203 domain-containing protein [Candidatus Acidoferrales bacterium]
MAEEFRHFTLTEAERTRAEVEPILIQAMEGRRALAEVEESLAGVARRIGMLGGSLVAGSEVSGMRTQHTQIGMKVQRMLEEIHATGCLVKDLEVGLLDFPAILHDEEVLLCWRLGEDRIRFYHGVNEGFASRRPLDPLDTGGMPPIQ